VSVVPLDSPESGLPINSAFGCMRKDIDKGCRENENA